MQNLARNPRFLRLFSRFPANFSETEGSSRLSPSWMIKLFKENARFPLNFQEKPAEDAPNYSLLAKELGNPSSMNQETFSKHLRDIHKEIQLSIEQSFENSSIKSLMSSVPSAFLCELAIENFVGSISTRKL